MLLIRALFISGGVLVKKTNTGGSHALKKHGVYFQEGLKKEKWIPGYLTEGYDFQNSRDNRYIPFIGFSRGKLVLVNRK